MMNRETKYSYDKEADVLYISFSPGEKATTAVELNEYFRIITNSIY